MRLLPAQYICNLVGEGQRVKRLEENCFNAEIGKAPLVGALHLGCEQQNRNLSGGRIGAQLAESTGSIHAWHHDVEKDGVWLMLDGAGQSLSAGTRDRKSTRLNSSHLGISYA